MKTLEPKPPPTSGEITRNLCSGMPRTNAPMMSRWTCGFCDVTHSVRGAVRIVGDHDRHCLADISDARDREWRLWRHLHVRQHPANGNAIHTTAGEYRAGEHGSHAGCRFGPRGVDSVNARVRVRTADERGVRRAGQRHVIREPSAAGEEAS